jgi:hypothetical protein
MKRSSKNLAAVFASCALAASSPARADQEATTEKSAAPMPAPRGAVELGYDAHYGRGVGSSAWGTRASDLTAQGIGFGLSGGLRLDPRWWFGFIGDYDDFSPGERLAGHARGIVVSACATYHFAPSGRIDPWITAGFGYRALWFAGQQPSHEELWHGFELARSMVGVDFRASDRVAVGPMFGADVNVFAWRMEGGTSEAIAARRPEAFFLAGLSARVDLGAGQGSPPRVSAARPP